MSAKRDTVTRDFLSVTVGKKSREIARLRAELDAARERFARVVGVHRCQCCGDAYEFTTQFGSWRTVDGGYQHKCPESDPNCGHFDATFFPGTLSADLDSARAALDKEREACDEYRESHRPDCSDETLGGRGPHATDHRCRKCREYDARRAAEAKE